MGGACASRQITRKRCRAEVAQGKNGKLAFYGVVHRYFVELDL